MPVALPPRAVLGEEAAAGVNPGSGTASSRAERAARWGNFDELHRAAADHASLIYKLGKEIAEGKEEEEDAEEEGEGEEEWGGDGGGEGEDDDVPRPLAVALSPEALMASSPVLSPSRRKLLHETHQRVT